MVHASPIYATLPFDHAKADIILRSSDNIDFRIFKQFLLLASPSFGTFLDTTKPAQVNGCQEIRDGLAVVPIAEDSKTLDALLRFCYPCTLTEDLKLEVCKDMVDVLDAARKYSLDAIVRKVRRALSDSRILAANPFRCFVIAHQGRLHEETLLAAKYTLTQPLIPSQFQEIDLIRASDLLSLLTYHRRCGDAVYAMRLNLSWITSHYKSLAACGWLSGREEQIDRKGKKKQHGVHKSIRSTSNCGCPGSDTPRYTLFDHRSPQWWECFVDETFMKLRNRPCEAVMQISAKKTVQVIKQQNCQACSPRIAKGMDHFLRLFAQEMDKTISQVELELKF